MSWDQTIAIGREVTDNQSKELGFFVCLFVQKTVEQVLSGAVRWIRFMHF